eukprot:4848602-Pyramimonas_sp.AAC.1
MHFGTPCKVCTRKAASVVRSTACIWRHPFGSAAIPGRWDVEISGTTRVPLARGAAGGGCHRRGGERIAIRLYTSPN